MDDQVDPKKEIVPNDCVVKTSSLENSGEKVLSKDQAVSKTPENCKVLHAREKVRLL